MYENSFWKRLKTVSETKFMIYEYSNDVLVCQFTQTVKYGYYAL